MFTDRPLNPDEWFEVTVRSAVECWSGSLRVCMIDNSVSMLVVLMSVN